MYVNKGFSIVTKKVLTPDGPFTETLLGGFRVDTKSVRLKIDLMEDNPGVSLVNVCPTCTVVTFGPRRAATRKTVSVPAKMQKTST